MAYYFANYGYSVLDNKSTVEYWVVDDKAKRDAFCACCPSTYPVLKKDIPEGEVVKVAKGHRRSFSGMFVYPTE